MFQMKYIIDQDDSVTIFSQWETHSDIAKKIGGTIVSAGFLSVGMTKDGIRASCYGESISLGLRSRKEDSHIVSKQMGLID